MKAALSIVFIMAASISHAADMCPADHPHARKVIDYTKSVQCTLMMCLPVLTCPAEGDCVYTSSSCNTCTNNTTEICLSDDELQRAQGMANPLSLPVYQGIAQ
jgi:hypothetical protein